MAAALGVRVKGSASSCSIHQIIGEAGIAAKVQLQMKYSRQKVSLKSLGLSLANDVRGNSKWRWNNSQKFESSVASYYIDQQKLAQYVEEWKWLSEQELHGEEALLSDPQS